MIKLKDLIKEGKIGSIYNMKKQMQDGTFEPDNPEVLIKGWGRLPLKHIEAKVANDLRDLAKRAKNGGESNFKGILNLLTKNDYIVEQSQAIIDVYKEMSSSQYKRVVTNYKRRK
jgi:hypothetical protein